MFLQSPRLPETSTGRYDAYMTASGRGGHNKEKEETELRLGQWEVKSKLMDVWGTCGEEVDAAI